MAQLIALKNTVIDVLEHLIYYHYKYPKSNRKFIGFRQKMVQLEGDIHWELDSSFLSVISWVFPNSIKINENNIFVKVGFNDSLRRGSRRYRERIDYDVEMREKYGNLSPSLNFTLIKYFHGFS